jgi:FkbM family methyltransferase
MLVSFKSLLKQIPFPLSKNHRYDLLTKKIIAKKCGPASNCIDVGAHRGEVFDHFLKYCSSGQHFAFEPIPELFTYLKEKYRQRSNCHIYDLALSDKTGNVAFNHVISNPAYSGIKKRKYDRKHEVDESIMVQCDQLDHIIPEGMPVHFMKIDVEGGEMQVLEGASRILCDSHPIIVFEFGVGGSDVYGTTPEKIYSFFHFYGYGVYLLEDFLNGKGPLGLDGLRDQFHNERNYYFVAH